MNAAPCLTCGDPHPPHVSCVDGYRYRKVLLPIGDRRAIEDLEQILTGALHRCSRLASRRTVDRRLALEQAATRRWAEGVAA